MILTSLSSDESQAAAMNLLDSLFQIIFARYRRRLGDGNLTIAWRRARTTLLLYLAPSIAAAIAILVVVVYGLTGTGTHLEHKIWGRAIAAPVVILVVVLLHTRFRRYLLRPPALSSEETKAQRRLVRRFYLASLAIFCATCLMGYLLRRAGVGFLQGL
jgi:hypothetical protein